MNFELLPRLASALRREASARHIEQHTILGWGSDFENCPNIHCQENARLLREAEASKEAALKASAQLSERRTVHEWLNVKGIPTEDPDGNQLCLLRRLAIALQVHEKPA